MTRILAFIAAGVILLAGVAWFVQPVQYESFALLRVAYRPPSVLNRAPESDDEFNIFKSTQLQLIKSGPVLRSVLRDPKIDQLSIIRRHYDDPVAWLERNLMIDYPDDAEILRVRLVGEEPQELNQIVDAVVKAYLSEVVGNERAKRLAQEERLERKYREYVEAYAKQTEALHILEKLNQVSGTEGARVKKRVHEEALFEAILQRNNILREIHDNESQIMLRKSGAVGPEGSQTADAPAAGDVDKANVDLSMLEKRAAYLKKSLGEAHKQIEEQAKSFEDLQQVSGDVAAKQEELAALKQIMNELKKELDRVQVERLAQERITLLDNAQLASDDGDVARRYARLAAAVAISLVFVGIGLVAGRRRYPVRTAQD